MEIKRKMALRHTITIKGRGFKLYVYCEHVLKEEQKATHNIKSNCPKQPAEAHHFRKPVVWRVSSPVCSNRHGISV